jgi:predicted ATPase/DNA-binding SARP family transcriptional activator
VHSEIDIRLTGANQLLLLGEHAVVSASTKVTVMADSTRNVARPRPQPGGTSDSTERPLPLGDERSRPPALFIRLLGGFEVCAGDTTIDPSLWRRRKAGHLVKLLALAPRRSLHRERVLEILWQDRDPAAAANNLRVTMHATRRILSSVFSLPETLLTIDGEQIYLGRELEIRTDVGAFEAAAEAALASADPDLYQRAIDLYTGDLLPDDRYDEWFLERRESLRATLLELLLGHAALLAARGYRERAIETLRRAVALDPLREDTHVALMRDYALAGRRDAALRQYQQLCKLLDQELGVRPSPATVRLHEDIASQRFPERPGNVTTLPKRSKVSVKAGSTIEHPRSNLPTAVSSFVGRTQETRHVSQLICESRLVTLTGPGGSGKTRLALHVAGGLVDEFADGVCLVELAPLAEPELVPLVVANALGVRLGTERVLVKRLVETLAPRHLLLVLDNCEHLVDACAGLAVRLLQDCPRIRIVCTSREALRVAGEVQYPVPPLAVPDTDTPSLRPDGGTLAESVQLFIERVTLSRPDFDLSAKTEPHVAEICRRLEGMPLAIELAASRVGVLSVAEIAARLDSALDLLSARNRDAPDRQRTLRGALDWSYRLLDDEEQALFRRLAVFAGGFSLAAAEFVGAGVSSERATVLDRLDSLLHKSLLRREEVAGGESRYHVLETIRAYGWERLLEAAEVEKARERHAAYFLDLARTAEPLSFGPEGERWLDRLETEHDNLRAALRWLVENGRTDQALRMARALGPFWWMRSYLTEGLERLEAALALTDQSASSPTERAKTLAVAAVLAESLDDYGRAERLGEQALGLYARIEDQDGAAICHLGLGVVAWKRGDLERARRNWDAALDSARQLGNAWHAGMALNNLGCVSLAEWDFDRAEQRFQEAIHLASDIGNKDLLAQPVAYLGELALRRGHYDEADARLREGLRLFQEIGESRFAARVLGTLAELSLAQGDPAQAIVRCRESIALLRTAGERYHLSQSITVLAQALVAQGRNAEAARLFGVAGSIRDAIGASLHSPAAAPHQRARDRARAALGEATFEAEQHAGRTMPLQEALDFALSLGDTTTPR